MIYAAILAGGMSDKMHRIDTPRQFQMLGTKPIIIHTLEQFILNPQIERIIIVASDEWVPHTQSLLLKWLPNEEEIPVIVGGVNKADSISKVVEHIDAQFGVNNSDILLAHDAIRPFVTQRIIDENLAAVKKYSAVNTVMETTDTMICSTDGKKITEVPPKSHMFAEQTPQTYNIMLLKDVFDLAGKDKIAREPEVPRLFVMQRRELYMVMGEYSNLKLVSPYDLEVANALLKETRHD